MSIGYVCVEARRARCHRTHGSGWGFAPSGGCARGPAGARRSTRGWGCAWLRALADLCIDAIEGVRDTRWVCHCNLCAAVNYALVGSGVVRGWVNSIHAGTRAGGLGRVNIDKVGF